MKNSDFFDIKRELLFVETAEEVESLIAQGADVNGLMGKVFPLALAANVEVAKALIENGADVNIKNKDGENALFLNKNVDVLRFLAEKGIKINHLNKNGENALFHTSDIRVVKTLIKLGCSPFIKNNDGFTHECKIKEQDKHEYDSFIFLLKKMIKKRMEQDALQLA